MVSLRSIVGKKWLGLNIEGMYKQVSMHRRGN